MQMLVEINNKHFYLILDIVSTGFELSSFENLEHQGPFINYLTSRNLSQHLQILLGSVAALGESTFHFNQCTYYIVPVFYTGTNAGGRIKALSLRRVRANCGR